MEIEVCADSFDTALMAERYMAKRIELCAGLAIGGLTPSPALTQQCSQIGNVEVHVMLRPREGNFCYNLSEIDTIYEDIEIYQQLGVRGVVVGCLDEAGNLNLSAMQRWTQRAQELELEITMHRAFDYTNNSLETLHHLIEMKVNRILTGGKIGKAIDGAAELSNLVKEANGRIQIMAGGGVDATNARQLINTGVDALHFTSHKISEDNGSLGKTFVPDEDKISAILEAIEY